MSDDLARSPRAPLITRRTLLRSLATFVGAAIVPSGDSRTTRILSQDNRKRIYIAADDHTDLWWTAAEATYLDAFVEMLDYYLNLADTTASLPSDFQSRWNCDGSYWIWTYERRKSADAFDRLITRIRDGHISVPLNALVLCLGGASAEAVLRGMYYPGQIERRYNLRFPLAIAMENQTLPYGLGALWAGSGARYSWKGICGCDTQMVNAGDREYEIYWWNSADGSQILMKWNSLLSGTNQSVGGYAEARDPAAVVEFIDTSTAFQSRFPYRVIGAFGKGWDDLKTLTDEFVTVAQQKTNSSRRVIVSNEQDFFKDFETTYGPSLPSLACSFGNEWDLYCAALNEVTSQVKRAVEQLRAAEALATLVSLYQPAFLKSRTAERDQAWMNLGLYWEHNFGMDGRDSTRIGQRVSWQRDLANTISQYSDSLLSDSVAALSGMIGRSGTDARFYVFNPLGWTRTDRAELPYSGTQPLHVVDLSSGAEVPSQIVIRSGQTFVQILAANVPPVGYRVYELRSGVGALFSPCATINGGMIDHAAYRVSVASRGAITSLIDKQNANRECVRQIGSLMANDLGSGAGTLSVESLGSVSVTICATGAVPLQHTSRITLIRDIARVEIENVIEENFNTTGTWAFGFDIDAPDIWHEEVGAVLRARLTSQGGHYSPINARYDWLTLNHFVAVSGADITVILSNADCHFMRIGNSTATTLDTSTPQVQALAGGQVHTAGKGIPVQGGDTRFLQRFALSTQPSYNQAVAMRVALEHQNPLVAAAVTGTATSPYPATNYSLLSISNPDTLLWALKPHDDGVDKGVVVRLWNMAGAASTTVSLSGGSIATAQQITHIETSIGAATVKGGALQAEFAPQQISSYLIQPITTPSLDPSHGPCRTNLPQVHSSP